MVHDGVSIYGAFKNEKKVFQIVAISMQGYVVDSDACVVFFFNLER